MRERDGAPFRHVALDSNILIYLVERSPEHAASLGRMLDRMIADGAELTISEIGVAECLYGAFKRADAAMEQRYRLVLFDKAFIRMLPLDFEVLIEAAHHGAKAGLKLIDAIHLRAAVRAGCDAFVTNDRALGPMDGLAIVQLASFAEG